MFNSSKKLSFLDLFSRFFYRHFLLLIFDTLCCPSIFPVPLCLLLVTLFISVFRPCFGWIFFQSPFFSCAFDSPLSLFRPFFLAFGRDFDFFLSVFLTLLSFFPLSPLFSFLSPFFVYPFFCCLILLIFSHLLSLFVLYLIIFWCMFWHTERTFSRYFANNLMIEKHRIIMLKAYLWKFVGV